MKKHILPALWRAYLINGDASELTESQHAECNAWLAANGLEQSACVGWQVTARAADNCYTFRVASEAAA